MHDVHFLKYNGRWDGNFHGWFLVFGNTFDQCLETLNKVLKRCESSNFVLNWKKCHVMVTKGIVLRQRVPSKGLEVDKENIDVIVKLPPLTNVKWVRSFLGRAWFYRWFIKYFSKNTKSLFKLLEKNATFKFDETCLEAYWRKVHFSFHHWFTKLVTTIWVSVSCKWLSHWCSLRPVHQQALPYYLLYKQDIEWESTK